MLSSVDLPQPDGPMSETNSPGCTSSDTSLTASTAPLRDAENEPSVADLDVAAGFWRSALMTLPALRVGRAMASRSLPATRIAPLHSRPSTPMVIMPEHDLGVGDQRVRFPGEVADAELARDHLGRDQRDPRHAHADRQAGEDVRQRAGQHHVPQQRRLLAPRHCAGAQQHRVDRLHAVDGVEQDREERRRGR